MVADADGGCTEAAALNTFSRERERDPQMTASRPRDQQTTSTFFSVKELAKDWKCSEKKVRREIKAGRLVAHSFGGLVRVSLADRLSYDRQRRLG